MNLDDWAVFGIGVMIALFYVAIGIGVAKMLAKIKDRDLRFADVYVWFFVALIFAVAGDCE